MHATDEQRVPMTADQFRRAALWLRRENETGEALAAPDGRFDAPNERRGSAQQEGRPGPLVAAVVATATLPNQTPINSPRENERRDSEQPRSNRTAQQHPQHQAAPPDRVGERRGSNRSQKQPQKPVGRHSESSYVYMAVKNQADREEGEIARSISEVSAKSQARSQSSGRMSEASPLPIHQQLQTVPTLNPAVAEVWRQSTEESQRVVPQFPAGRRESRIPSTRKNSEQYHQAQAKLNEEALGGKVEVLENEVKELHRLGNEEYTARLKAEERVRELERSLQALQPTTSSSASANQQLTTSGHVKVEPVFQEAGLGLEPLARHYKVYNVEELARTIKAEEEERKKKPKVTVKKAEYLTEEEKKCETLGELLRLWKFEAQKQQRASKHRVTPFSVEDLEQHGPLTEVLKQMKRADIRKHVMDLQFKKFVEATVRRGKTVKQCALCTRCYASDEIHQCLTTGHKTKDGCAVLVTQRKNNIKIGKASSLSIEEQLAQIKSAQDHLAETNRLHQMALETEKSVRAQMELEGVATSAMMVQTALVFPDTWVDPDVDYEDPYEAFFTTEPSLVDPMSCFFRTGTYESRPPEERRRSG